MDKLLILYIIVYYWIYYNYEYNNGLNKLFYDLDFIFFMVF